MRNSKGQNLIEYVLLVAAVLIVCIAFFMNGTMSRSVNAGLNSILNEINIINSQINLNN